MRLSMKPAFACVIILCRLLLLLLAALPLSAKAAPLAEIQRATLRLAAVHKAGTITAAARLVGVSHVGLNKWFKAREYPRDLAPALTVYDKERLAETKIDSDSEPK